MRKTIPQRIQDGLEQTINIVLPFFLITMMGFAVVLVTQYALATVGTSVVCGPSLREPCLAEPAERICAK